MLKLLFTLILVLSLTACATGPKYVRPEVETPTTYKEAGAWKTAQPNDALSRGRWWEMFGDPQLNTLIEQVDISNQNLLAAQARFRQARALVASARAAYFPFITASASSTRSQSPSNNQRTTTNSGINNSHQLALDLNWEIDLWNRIGQTVNANTASAQASAADVETARLSAQTDLAQNYFLLRVTDAQRKLLDDTIAAYQKTLELTQNRYKAGVASRADVVQAETQLKSTQAQAVDIGIQRAQLENAIALLIGKPASNFSIEPAPFAISLPQIPSGLPSELLERRPDIAAAERRVAAANAEIGVAKAAFFPSLTLSASGGFQNSSFANLLTLPSRFWSIGPALAATIFDAGQRRAETERAIAAYDETVASYRETVLIGFQQVEDNLVALRLLEQEAALQNEAVAGAREALALTLNQYKAGTVSYLNVVTTQAAALSNERTAVNILGRQLTASVFLIKALGGGWEASNIALLNIGYAK